MIHPRLGLHLLGEKRYIECHVTRSEQSNAVAVKWRSLIKLRGFCRAGQLQLDCVV